MPESVKEHSSVTETPWFWLMLFSLAGLAAIVTIGPKFERREQSIETKFHARERGAGREAVEQPDDNAPAELPVWKPIFTLGPIAAVLAVVVVVSMIGMLRCQQRERFELPRRAKPQADADTSATDHAPRTTC